MTKFLSKIDSLALQQNNYKSLCYSQVQDLDFFKLFYLFEYEKPLHNNIAKDITEGINFSFSKLLKANNLSSSNLEYIFEECLKDFNKYLLDLIKISGYNINLKHLNIFIGGLLGQSLIFTYVGKFLGFLTYKSKDAQYKIVSFVEETHPDHESTSLFKDITLGEIQGHNTLLFCTENLSKYLSTYKLKFLMLNTDHTVDNFYTVLKQTTNNDNFACILIRNFLINNSTVKIKESTVAKPISKIHPDTDKSLLTLEKTRDKTRELLSPSLLLKIKNFWQKHSLKINNLKQLSSLKRPSLQKSMPNLKKQGTKKPEQDNVLFKISFAKIGVILKNYSLNVLNFLRKYFLALFNLLKNKVIAWREQKIAINKQPSSKKLELTEKKENDVFFNFNTQKLKFLKLNNLKIFINALITKLHQKKNFSLSVGAVLVFIIIAFIVSSSLIRENKLKQDLLTQYNTLIKNIDEQLLKTETSLIHQAKETAAIHNNNAVNFITDLKKLQNNKYLAADDLSDKIAQYQKKTENFNDQILNISRLNAPLFLNLQTEDTPTGFEINNNNLYIFGKIILALDLLTKKLTEINTSASATYVQACLSAKDNSLLLLNNAQILDKLDLTKNSLKTQNILWPSRNITDFKIYNNNLYQLAATDNSIYKFNQTSAGFSAGKSWRTDTAFSLTNAVDMFIDGSIFILLNNGQIVNYLNGKFFPSFGNEYAIVSPKITAAEKLRRNTSNNKFYILEKPNRLIQFSSTGKFENQYYIENLTEITDFIIQDDTNTLLLLSENKIYSLKI